MSYVFASPTPVSALDWDTMQKESYRHGRDHGLSISQAMRHSEEIMEAYEIDPALSAIEVIDHGVNHIELYSLEGYIYCHETVSPSTALRTGTFKLHNTGLRI